MKPDRALGDWLKDPSAASYDGIGAAGAAGKYPGGKASPDRAGIANGEVLSPSTSSRIGGGRLLGPASSGPGLVLADELELELEKGFPVALPPDSELERLFLNIDLMLIPDDAAGDEVVVVGASLLALNVGPCRL
jgi:hypothetical protein